MKDIVEKIFQKPRGGTTNWNSTFSVYRWNTCFSMVKGGSSSILLWNSPFSTCPVLLSLGNFQKTIGKIFHPNMCKSGGLNTTHFSQNVFKNHAFTFHFTNIHYFVCHIRQNPEMCFKTAKCGKFQSKALYVCRRLLENTGFFFIFTSLPAALSSSLGVFGW